MPDRFKTQMMYDEAVDDCLATLKFIPDWFVTSKMLEKLDNGLHTLIMISSFPMKILMKLHLLPIKDIFLL